MAICYFVGGLDFVSLRLKMVGRGALLMGCQVVEALTRFPRPEQTLTRDFLPAREWSAYSAGYDRLCFSGVLPWTERQAPHLTGRGHMPGHSVDQLLRDWLKSDGMAMSFCPDLRMK
jgi:hypothetical protein